MHQLMAATLDTVIAEIRAIQRRRARRTATAKRPRWPMIVLRTPKGWTGPKEVDGKQDRRHLALAPGAVRRHGSKPEHLKLLEDWMKSYRPEELFDASGTLQAGARGARADRRRGAWAPIRTPTAALLLQATCDMPDFRDYAVEVPQPGGGDRPRRRG